MRPIIEEYICDVLRWWWVIVIGIVGGIGSYILKIWPGIPQWVWISLPVLGLIIAQFLAYKKLWVKYDELKPSNWISVYERFSIELFSWNDSIKKYSTDNAQCSVLERA
jgi:hypothetical protein